MYRSPPLRLRGDHPRGQPALIDALDQRIGHVDAWLIHQWGEDPRVRRLMTLPGIGRFTAIASVGELGDIHRFPTAKHLANYVGLAPVVRSSADHDPRRGAR
jgi:transposase